MQSVLEFRELYRTMGNHNSFIKESGQVASGCILSVRGASGAGKSTLLRMLARLLMPESGDMYLRGEHWRSIPPEVWRRRAQYLSQKPVMFAGTVEDNFIMPFSIRKTNLENGFSVRDLEVYLNILDLPQEIMSQKAQTLSGGEASRVALIRALLVEPEVLLLDEPTAYLDGESRIKVISLISRWVKERPDRAVIVVSHNQEDLVGLDNVSFLDIVKEGTEFE
ncbi:MAG: ATP-binding cassette domain-containing protein [Ignavibacteriales bacterium]